MRTLPALLFAVFCNLPGRALAARCVEGVSIGQEIELWGRVASIKLIDLDAPKRHEADSDPGREWIVVTFALPGTVKNGPVVGGQVRSSLDAVTLTPDSGIAPNQEPEAFDGKFVRVRGILATQPSGLHAEPFRLLYNSIKLGDRSECRIIGPDANSVR